MNENKLICTECGHKIEKNEKPLIAPHPFIKGNEIWGCPKCKEVETLAEACSEEGCFEPATNGYPDPVNKSYILTCNKHCRVF